MNIGIVKDVIFIKKVDGIGREYNGAIVIFKYWFMNPTVTKLFDDLNSSANGTIKFTYNCNRQYWFINVHKPIIEESKEDLIVDIKLSDKNRIEELEKKIKSMSSQLHYMQIRQEKTECQLMEVEEKQSHQALCNMELRFQLEDKDIEITWLKRDIEKTLETCSSTDKEMVIDELM